MKGFRWPRKSPNAAIKNCRRATGKSEIDKFFAQRLRTAYASNHSAGAGIAGRNTACRRSDAGKLPVSGPIVEVSNNRRTSFHRRGRDLFSAPMSMMGWPASEEFPETPMPLPFQQAACATYMSGVNGAAEISAEALCMPFWTTAGHISGKSVSGRTRKRPLHSMTQSAFAELAIHAQHILWTFRQGRLSERRLISYLRPIEPVAGVAEARHDEAFVVQPAVQSARYDRYVRMRR